MILKCLPFSLQWIVRQSIGDNVKTILDLGCGDGEFTQTISYGENWKITGVELFKDSLKHAKKIGLYEKLIKASITELPSTISNQKYDVVVAFQVIEHLNKQIGLNVLEKWERLATKKIIISTPVGFIEYHRLEKKDKEKNKLQKHLSGWDPKELGERGYKIYGQGVKLVYGEAGLARKVHPVFRPILFLFSYLLSPLVFFFPSMATYMIAVKKIG